MAPPQLVNDWVSYSVEAPAFWVATRHDGCVVPADFFLRFGEDSVGGVLFYLLGLRLGLGLRL